MLKFILNKYYEWQSRRFWKEVEKEECGKCNECLICEKHVKHIKASKDGDI